MASQNKIQQSKKGRFLKAYIQTASISRAAIVAKIDRGRHYQWLKEDPDYKEAFEEAQEVAIQGLEDEAIRRAYEGVDEPVYQQGEQVGTIRRYSDTLMIFLLKAFRPGKYRDKALESINVPDRVIVEWKRSSGDQ